MSNPIIKIEHVNLWYDKGKPTEVHALKDINAEIDKGEYASFFGPSGCGKTTMLYAIAGIDRYQEGTISINDRDITGLTNQELAIFRQTGIGIVFQQFNLVPSLTVTQNVALPMAFLGIASEKATSEAVKLLERLNLSAFGHRFPHELSGGQQQRVGIARALANNPPIIVADEPLGNLDSANAKNALAFFKELNEKDGRTIIMVTHEAWSLQDVKKIFYMKDGVLTSTERQNPETIADSLSSRLYKELSPTNNQEEMSAHILSNFLMRGYSMEEVKRFEFFLNERFTTKIDALDFRKSIDRPFKDGGVGLWSQKAQRISERVEQIIEKRKDLEAIHQIVLDHPELPIAEEVAKIRDWVAEEYEGTLSDFQRIALSELISDRVRSQINADKFRDLLSKPSKEFGLGLSYRAAQKITEKLEAIMTNDNSSVKA